MSIHAKLVALSRVALIKAGYAFRSAIEDVAHGAVHVVQMKDVDPVDGVRWAGVARTQLAGRQEADWLLANDLLFVSRGTRFHAACIGAPPSRAVCGPHLFHLRVKPGHDLLPAFVAWQINQPPFQRELRRAAEGSSQLSVRRPVLEALPIAVPALADQEHIVALARLAQRERQLQAELVRNRERQFESIAEALARKPVHHA